MEGRQVGDDYQPRRDCHLLPLRLADAGRRHFDIERRGPGWLVGPRLVIGTERTRDAFRRTTSAELCLLKERDYHGASRG